MGGARCLRTLDHKEPINERCAGSGRLPAQGRTNIHAPGLGLTTFFTLAVTLTLLTFTGEAVRGAFDPPKET